MRKIIASSILVLFALVGFGGCGKSATKCDNSDAKKLVYEIVEEETKRQLLGPYYGVLDKEVQAQKRAEVDKKYQEANPQLINIRPESMDNELEKSECSADLEMSNGNKLPIKYKLSKTSEGKLYGEVFGLK